jgi:hypothetical protein
MALSSSGPMTACSQVEMKWTSSRGGEQTCVVQVNARCDGDAVASHTKGLVASDAPSGNFILERRRYKGTKISRGTPVAPRTRKVVGATGFEPATPCAQAQSQPYERRAEISCFIKPCAAIACGIASESC